MLLFLASATIRSSPSFHRHMARVRHTAKVMEGEGPSSNPEEQTALLGVLKPSRHLPHHHPAWSLVRFLAWIGMLALARVAVLHPPLVAMKVKVWVMGVMSK
jgi:hypothetical protein